MTAPCVRARLIELTGDFKEKKDGGHEVDVQFNPESLKLTFANQLEQSDGNDQSSGNSGRQFVGAGTTKLALSLWFDVTAMQENAVDDVRRLTQKVLYFMTPQKSEQDETKLVPPAVRFCWGSFLFDGLVEGVEESIELFSPEGKALRASLSLTLSQQKILESRFEGDGRVPARIGQRPLNQVKDGDSVQQMAARQGKDDWQSIAAANGIEDPLRPSPGQFLNLAARTPGGAGPGAGVSIGVGASLAAGASFGVSPSPGGGTGLNAALGGGLGASFDARS